MKTAKLCDGSNLAELRKPRRRINRAMFRVIVAAYVTGTANLTAPRRFKNGSSSAVRAGTHAILGTGASILPRCGDGDGVSTAARTVVPKQPAQRTTYVGRLARAAIASCKQLLRLKVHYLRQLSAESPAYTRADSDKDKESQDF